MGALMVNQFLDYGFEFSFLFVSVCLLLLSGMIFFTMVDHPKCVGLPDTDALEEDLLRFKTKKKDYFFLILIMKNVFEVRIF